MRLAAPVLAALALAPAAAAAPLEVRTSLDPRTVLFGAPATAEVAVVVDPALVDPGSVRIEADTAPWRRLDPPELEREEAGGTVVVRQRSRIACTTSACLPRAELRGVALPRVRVTARRRDGSTVTAGAAWPAVLVAPRATAEAATGAPAWRIDTTPPAVTTRFAPGALAAALWALAAVLAAAAVALAAWEALRWRRRRAAGRASELAAAIAAVRAAAAADEPERRRALGRLARVLEREDGAHVARAASLAWDEPVPEPERLTALADDVEREVPA